MRETEFLIFEQTFSLSRTLSLLKKYIQFDLRWNFHLKNCFQGDGIFSPGGSLSNMYGMVLARHRKHPDLKSTGWSF